MSVTLEQLRAEQEPVYKAIKEYQKTKDDVSLDIALKPHQDTDGRLPLWIRALLDTQLN